MVKKQYNTKFSVKQKIMTNDQEAIGNGREVRYIAVCVSQEHPSAGTEVSLSERSKKYRGTAE